MLKRRTKRRREMCVLQPRRTLARKAARHTREKTISRLQQGWRCPANRTRVQSGTAKTRLGSRLCVRRLWVQRNNKRQRVLRRAHRSVPLSCSCRWLRLHQQKKGLHIHNRQTRWTELPKKSQVSMWRVKNQTPRPPPALTRVTKHKVIKRERRVPRRRGNAGRGPGSRTRAATVATSSRTNPAWPRTSRGATPRR